jgi:aerobic-type carbon monoxide dehydrogenase small subunit (CoxS/CutS family)
MEKGKGKGVSRRSFLKGLGGGALGGAILSAGLLRYERAEAYPRELTWDGKARSIVELRVNGRRYRLEVEHRQTLAEVLRDPIGLTGTKIGCNRGECGACTVVVDGESLYACSLLAVWMRDKEILTIEGLERGGKLDPLQQAFIDHDGPQCGFCTAGQIMAAKALLMRNPNPTEAQVRRALSGNLCRCGNYNREVTAVLAAARKNG